MSLLSIISDPEQGAAVLCGLPSPTTIIGSNDANVPLLLRLANQEGRSLARRHDWQALTVDYTVPTLGGELQTALPSDFDRLLPYPEFWNRSISQMYRGPTSPATWGQIQALGVTTGAPGWWRLLGNSLYITPAPTAAQTLAFYYVSKNWVDPVSGSNKAAFTLDTDVALVPEHLMTLGIVWRYGQSQGLDYAEDMATYERELELACSRDRGLQIIRPRPGNRDPLANTSWPGVITP